MSTTLTVNGTPINLTTAGVVVESLRPHARHGSPGMTFSARGGALAALPDPYLNKSCSLAINGTTYFAGYVAEVAYVFDPRAGWLRVYTCSGYRTLGDLVPVTNDDTTTDTLVYNTDPQDTINYLPERSGRTLGQVVVSVLEQNAISAALQALGVGAYTTTGSGAAGHATISAAGVVTGLVLDAGGSGYTATPTVLLVGGGGSGATGSATVSGGVVTGLSLGVGGSGYTSPPQVIVSRLPAVTLADCAALTIIPTYPITIAGERVLSAIEGAVNAAAPNHQLHVEPSGTIRLLDQRNAGKTVATITGGGGSGARIAPIVIGGVITGISVIAGGSGYGAPSVSITDPNGTGATATATVAGGVVTAVTVTAGGSGYLGGAIPLEFGADPRLLPPKLRRSIADNFSAVVVRGQPLTQPRLLTQSKGTLVQDFAHDGLTNAQAISAWEPSDYQNPAEASGTAKGTASLSGATVGGVTVYQGGYGYTAAPAVSFVGGGGSGATATATISGGAVTGVTMVTNGSGYTSAPTVVFGVPNVGNSDSGTCTCPSTTQVTVTSIDPNVNWPAGWWDQTQGGHQGTILLNYSAGTGIDATFSARIVATGALSAGGSATLTLDQAMPITSYDSYVITGTSGGGSIVWRQYKVADAATGAALANRFAWAVAMPNSDGTASVMTSTPIATVLWSSTGSAPYLEAQVPVTINPDAGTILFSKPTVMIFGTAANNYSDGVPTDVRFFAAINTGANQVREPSSGYAGTSNAVEGLQRVLTVQADDWRDPSGLASMTTFATDLLGTVQDTFVEGPADWLGLLEAALAAGAAATITGSPFATPFDGVAIPLAGCELTYHMLGDGDGVAATTRLDLSNRRTPWSSAPFRRTPQSGLSLGFGEGQGWGDHSEPAPAPEAAPEPIPEPEPMPEPPPPPPAPEVPRL